MSASDRKLHVNVRIQSRLPPYPQQPPRIGRRDVARKISIVLVGLPIHDLRIPQLSRHPSTKSLRESGIEATPISHLSIRTQNRSPEADMADLETLAVPKHFALEFRRFETSWTITNPDFYPRVLTDADAAMLISESYTDINDTPEAPEDLSTSPESELLSLLDPVGQRKYLHRHRHYSAQACQRLGCS